MLSAFLPRLQIAVERRESRLHVIALADMKDRVVLQQRNRLMLSCFLIFSFQELKEKDHRSFLTLSDGMTFFDGLFVCHVFAFLRQHQLIQDAVWFACCSADCAARTLPRLMPRNRSVFQFLDNPVSDCLISLEQKIGQIYIDTVSGM